MPRRDFGHVGKLRNALASVASDVLRTQPHIRTRTRRRILVVADAEEQLRHAVPPVTHYITDISSDRPELCDLIPTKVDDARPQTPEPALYNPRNERNDLPIQPPNSLSLAFGFSLRSGVHCRPVELSQKPPVVPLGSLAPLPALMRTGSQAA